jgi:hypothetical protein
MLERVSVVRMKLDLAFLYRERRSVRVAKTSRGRHADETLSEYLSGALGRTSSRRQQEVGPDRKRGFAAGGEYTLPHSGEKPS